MKHAVREPNYNFHSPLSPPQITVESGEVFTCDTELNTGNWLGGEDDHWTPEKDRALNPTVVIAVEGAEPGDILAVDVLEVTPEDVGYTGFTAEKNPLANLIRIHDWGVNEKTVRIKEGWVHWSGGVKLPVKPMIGTLGTAPKEEILSNAKGGLHGGNMDVQEVAPGATVYLPVEVPGALLHVGDVHALQGDGEINCAGGIECRSTVRLRARIVKRPESYACVRIENQEYIMAVSCERSLEESFYKAASEIIGWMSEDYGFTVREAYLLMGQVLEARCTQFVNPTRSYICKMPKKHLGK
ncbi:MAG: acetamidase/formamidase family protein [Christensenellales bacterium]|jgi:amidase